MKPFPRAVVENINNKPERNNERYIMKHGDKAKVINPSRLREFGDEGMLGMIVTVLNQLKSDGWTKLGEITYRVKKPDGMWWELPDSCLELLEDKQTEGEQKHEMKPGDKAKVINPSRLAQLNDGNMFGEIVTIAAHIDTGVEWCRQPGETIYRIIRRGGIFWWLPSSCLEKVEDKQTEGEQKHEMKENDKAILKDTYTVYLSDFGLSSFKGKEVTLVRSLTQSERELRSKLHLANVHPSIVVWWIHIPGEGSSKWYVPECCLQSINKTNQINQTNPKGNMIYTIRALQTPNALAQQAGEKEKIVLPATDVVAENEYAAIAIAAADNADVIKAVQESKGSLRIIVKSNNS